MESRFIKWAGKRAIFAIRRNEDSQEMQIMVSRDSLLEAVTGDAEAFRYFMNEASNKIRGKMGGSLSLDHVQKLSGVQTKIRGTMAQAQTTSDDLIPQKLIELEAQMNPVPEVEVKYFPVEI